MKKSLQFIFALMISMFIYSSVLAQESAGITFSIIKKDGKVLSANAQGQKVIDFNVTGLNSKEEVDAFVEKFEKMKLVADIVISYEAENGSRVGYATFESNATKLIIKNALLYSGVTQVIVDGVTTQTKDILLKETDRKTETNSTK